VLRFWLSKRAAAYSPGAALILSLLVGTPARADTVAVRGRACDKWMTKAQCGAIPRRWHHGFVPAELGQGLLFHRDHRRCRDDSMGTKLHGFLVGAALQDRFGSLAVMLAGATFR
jgi:hypothetical protein